MTSLLFAPPALGNVLSLTGLPGGSNKIHDRSPYGNVGTVFGATWVRLPGGLWVLSFDGNDDYADFGSHPSLLSDVLTVEAWYKYEAQAFSPLLSWSTGATPSIWLRWNEEKPLLYLGGANFRYFSPSSPVNLYDGNYHRVVFVLTGNGQNDIDDARMYVDRYEQDVVSTVKTGLPDAKSVLKVGYNSYSSGKYFRGPVALLTMRNREASLFQVQSLFDQEKHLFGVW